MFECNIVFCGEVGTGKSSAINLLLGTTSARVSNDPRPCTQASASYEMTLHGTKYTLWDTRGLGEGYSFLQNIFRFGAGSEKELKKFLKDRHQRHKIDLLVYCVHGSRATDASVKYYNNFCAITRELAAPVVIMVTHLEREPHMENWWDTNSSTLNKFNMRFDGHVCITTLSEHAQARESRRRLVDLITRTYNWKPKRSGSYFGSPVQTPTPSVPPRKGLISSLFRSIYKGDSDGEHPRNRLSTPPSPSTGPSSYHTPECSAPQTPIVEPSTPTSAATTVRATHPDLNPLRVGGSSQSSSGETSSVGSSLYSLEPTGSLSSNTSNSDVHLQSCTEESDDYLMNELPFKHSTATVVRRQSFATQQGSFGDIWECDLISGDSSRMVAVKAVRPGTNDHEDLTSCEKKLRRELRVWGRLQHRNIVPLLGIVSGFGPLPSMVSPWFSNGSLSRYLAHRQMYRQMSRLEKHQLLEDIAAGLSYLHSHGVVHGDLHSDNVLIDEHGRACLTDFGLSFINEFLGTSYLNSSICGGVHFADPALVRRVDKSQGRAVYPTEPCDIYSFGGLMLHVLSGKKPFHGFPLHDVLFMVFGEQRPPIPPHDEFITPRDKSLIQRCWDPKECNRPSADNLANLASLTLMPII